MKSMNEELLTVGFGTRKAVPGITADVMVDRPETGSEWQGKYKDYSDFDTRVFSQAFCEGVMNEVSTPKLQWSKVFNYGDLAAKQAHFVKQNGGAVVDAADLVMWCGHATIDGQTNTPYCIFFVDLKDGVKQPVDRLVYTDMALGQTDADWVVFNTCRFLIGTNAQLGSMCDRVHLICGYATRMRIHRDAGEYFARCLRGGLTIKDAWFAQARKYQESGKVARVFGAVNNANDKVQAFGPDPTPTAKRRKWDYKTP